MAKNKGRSNSFYQVSAVLFAVGVLAVIGIANSAKSGTYSYSSSAAEYSPKINPKDFTTNITNKFFSLPPGKTMVYELETADGLERIEITITGSKKKVMGVNTLVYRDKVWMDDGERDGKWTKEELVEDTKDYLAQNIKTGDVWYFGEDVKNYENGQYLDSDGAWIADPEEGVYPGIWIKGKHKVGDRYLQEFSPDVAEDTRDVKAVNLTVKTGMGTFKGCVKMFDWTPLDPTSLEHKYYCPEVGALVKSEHLDEEGNVIDTTELVKVTNKRDMDEK